ncbi:MAG: NUDIX hydrolase [Verrucomicrobiae bacterium]|nr:NUDIX hydrolase [Verrucomicrobiae bacterium]
MFSLLSSLQNASFLSSDEEDFRFKMLHLLQNEPRCFYRDCFPAHFTGSALIIDPENRSILLNHHRILNKWLQFGGHCDGNENILEVAYREALEESGMTSLKVFSQTFIDLDIHEIPVNAKRQEPAHFHYDVRFVFAASQRDDLQVSDESHELKWFSFEETRYLNLDRNLLRLINKAMSFK